MFDLAIAGNGDVIFAPSGDLAGKSGTDLINQRISLRLRLHRGEWTYDDDDSLGSQLFRLIGESQAKAAALAPAYVREALRPMATEIAVDDVQATFDSNRNMTLGIIYHVLNDLGGTADQAAQTVEITILFGGSV